MNTSILPFPQLLTPPIKRAAYSDRMGWLMAVLSKLAYIPFEEPCSLDEVLTEIQSLASRDGTPDQRAKLRRVLERVLGTKGQNSPLSQLQDQLAALQFRLIQTFSVHVPWGADTQAFLAKIDQAGRDPFLVLSFRGTEGRKIEDIKTDLNAKALVLGRWAQDGVRRFIPAGSDRRHLPETDEDLVKVHPGFWQAFEAVRPQIEAAVSKPEFKDLPLYITGHSLGGAIATVATYVLASDRVAACYTYGAPRVGNASFGHCIKVPIYRFINASDIVPRLLPGVVMDVVASVLQGLRFIPFVRKGMAVLDRYREYRHFGDLRYVSGGVELPCLNGKPSYEGLWLYANPPQLQRWYWSACRVLRHGPGSMFYDHKIDQYINKLACWAQARL